MTSTNANSVHSPLDRRWRPDLRSPLVIGLIALLAVQLIAALVLGQGFGRTGRSLAPSDLSTPLLAFAPDRVTRIRIQGVDETGGVTLARTDTGWVLAGLDDFPAQGMKVDQLLKDLANLKRPLPTGTTEAARERFKVADDDFERRVILEGEDGPIATLIAGESPGFRRLFARPPEDPAVYDLPLALSDLSTRRDDWLDTGVLRLEQDDIVRIAGKDWTLTKNEGTWSLADGAQPLDQAAADDLARRLANLGYRGVLGTAEDPAYNQKDPSLELSIGLADGSTRSYRISKAEQSEDYVLKEADRPYYFKLSEYDLEGLIGLTPQQLMPTAPDSAEIPAEDATTTPVSSNEETASAPADPMDIPSQQTPDPSQ